MSGIGDSSVAHQLHRAAACTLEQVERLSALMEAGGGLHRADVTRAVAAAITLHREVDRAIAGAPPTAAPDLVTTLTLTLELVNDALETIDATMERAAAGRDGRPRGRGEEPRADGAPVVA